MKRSHTNDGGKSSGVFQAVLLRCGVGLMALGLMTGCKQRGPDPDAGAATKGRAVKTVAPSYGVPTRGPSSLPGQIRMSDKQWPSAAFVGHDARMDLQTVCRKAIDLAKKKAEKEPGLPIPPLCFDAKPHNRVRQIRVEFEAGARAGNMIGTLRTRSEAAHFMVERSGSVYQLLDLAYSPRRAGAYQAGEVRVLSARATTHKKLVGALTKLLGKVPVTEVATSFKPPGTKQPERGTKP